VTGGEPGTPQAARIFFNCLDVPMTPARYVEHETGNVADAERALLQRGDDELRELLAQSVPNE
jgi:hypothetical protein